MVKISEIVVGMAYAKRAADGSLHIRKITFIPPKGVKKGRQTSKIKFERWVQPLGGKIDYDRCDALPPELMMAWLREAHLHQAELPKLKRVPCVTPPKPKMARAPKLLEMALA